MSAAVPSASRPFVPQPFVPRGHWVEAASRAYDAVALRLATVLLALMILLVAAQVVLRYGLNAPLTWSEELTTYLFGWLIFLGATVTVRRDAAPSLAMLV